MSKQEYLMELIVRDIVEYLVTDEKIAIKKAMTWLYSSAIFEKLFDSETGLYLQSSAYVYDLLRDELQNGRIVQREI
jgi:hypothetical protein